MELGHTVVVLQSLILISAANGAPLVSTRMLGRRFAGRAMVLGSKANRRGGVPILLEADLPRAFTSSAPGSTPRMQSYKPQVEEPTPDVMFLRRIDRAPRSDPTLMLVHGWPRGQCRLAGAHSTRREMGESAAVQNWRVQNTALRRSP
jgi:hypothetical protein